MTVKKHLYLDFASATPMAPEVLKQYAKTATTFFANPSALHTLGVQAHKELTKSRESVAHVLGAHSDEIIFTGGGTEGDNVAIIGVIKSAQTHGIQKPHVIVSSIEHAAILETVKKLEAEKQITVSICPVTSEGIILVSELAKLLQKNTVLVSVMYANNEIGAVQPIREIAKAIRHFKKSQSSKLKAQSWPLFHTDATQAPNYLELTVEKLGVDLMTLNGSKIYGPKGVGALYIKRGTSIESVFFGGEQEKGIRPGTENLPAISAFTLALSSAQKMRIKESERLQKIQTVFLKKLKILFPQLIVNGSITQRLPNNINVTIPPYESEKLVLYLDAFGIYVSEKSACKSTLPNASHVLTALGVDDTTLGSIRFSMGRTTKMSDVSYVVSSLQKISKILNKNR